MWKGAKAAVLEEMPRFRQECMYSGAAGCSLRSAMVRGVVKRTHPTEICAIHCSILSLIC